MLLEDLIDTKLYGIKVLAEILGVPEKRARAIEAQGGIRRAPFQGKTICFSGAEIKRAVAVITAPAPDVEPEPKVVILSRRRRRPK
jgi:hypothetical protein